MCKSHSEANWMEAENMKREGLKVQNLEKRKQSRGKAAYRCQY